MAAKAFAGAAKTAKTTGISIPANLLALAAEVIEEPH
jgi:hypothetical protein